MQNVYAFNAVKNHSSHATPVTLTLTRSSNGTTNGSSISVMSLRTSVLDSRGASSSTDTRHHDNNTSTQHTHPLTHITMATTRQHSILIHWYTSPQQQQINTASESTDTRHHSNNTATSPTKTCHHGNNMHTASHPLTHVTTATTYHQGNNINTASSSTDTA